MINDEIPGERVSPAGRVQGVPFGIEPRTYKGSPIVKRDPVIIWLNSSDQDSPPNPWKTGNDDGKGYEWGNDSIQDFADRLVESKYFDHPDAQQPTHGDIIAGLDKADVTVILKVTVPVHDGELNEQDPAPDEFKEE
jgi:hypothetical protein